VLVSQPSRLLRWFLSCLGGICEITSSAVGWLMVREVLERVSETAREAFETVSGRRDVFEVTKSLYIMDSLSGRQSR
jgi:hypothetical protein